MANIKPTALHKLTGAHKKDPQRARSNEAKPRLGIGSAPVNANAGFSDIWDEVVDNVCPGVLGNCDRIHLEIVCRLISQFRLDPEGISSAKIGMIEKMLGKLGMNPIDRIKITVPEGDEKNPEDEYF